MKIVTSSQMREIEQRSEAAGVSTDALMERAGLEAARRVRHHMGHLSGVPVLVLVGPGNNGGDGLVAARRLHQWGARVTVALCARRREPDPKADRLRSAGVTIMEASDEDGVRCLREPLSRCHTVVDAVLGTGRSRPIEGALREAMLALRSERERRPDLRLFALDVPSGLDADTGGVDEVCSSADVTVAFGYPKIGLYAYPGADNVGKVEVVDIGLPPGLDDDVKLRLMTAGWVGGLLPSRPSDAHKGSFGKTLVVAGSQNYAGAASLAAGGAMRVGAGLVTVAAPERLQASILSRSPEPTYLPLPESGEESARIVLEAAPGYDAVLIGCGLGQAPGTVSMVRALLLSGGLERPLVIDADGLNALASLDEDWAHRVSGPAVLTPHAGEMARLLGRSIGEIQGARLTTALDSAAAWGHVVVLKGAHTIVASPDGDGAVSPFANPGLATAGTGDVLAGAIGGLLSQGVAPYEAAVLGVYLHGAAGERVTRRIGTAGLAASDLLPELPMAIRELRGTASRR